MASQFITLTRGVILLGSGFMALYVNPLETNFSPAHAAEKAEPLDINTASEEQLRALPGIGEKFAFYIIKKGPYKRKDELMQ